MREAAVVDDISVGLLRLKILSHDGDTFYAGCTLNHPLIEVERMDSVSVPCIVGFSDSDRSAYFSWPWTEKGCLSMIIRCNRNPGEVQATGAEGCWRLGNVSCDPFGGVLINLDWAFLAGTSCWKCEAQGDSCAIRTSLFTHWSTPRTSILVLRVIHVCFLGAWWDNSVARHVIIRLRICSRLILS